MLPQQSPMLCLCYSTCHRYHRECIKKILKTHNDCMITVRKISIDTKENQVGLRERGGGGYYRGL